MTFSTSIKAYADCFDLLDQALASTIGIRNRCADPGSANQLRGRLHYARNLHRKESREIYEPDDPNYDSSVYDPLLVRIREADKGWWVYIEHRKPKGVIEELVSDETPLPPLPPEPKVEEKIQILKRRWITA